MRKINGSLTAFLRPVPLMLLLSGCAFFFLCFPVPILDFWKPLLVVFPVTFWLAKNAADRKFSDFKVSRGNAVPLVSAAVLIGYLGQAFYYRWIEHSKVNMVAYLLRIPVKLLVIPAGFVLAVAALPAAAALCCRLWQHAAAAAKQDTVPAERSAKPWLGIAVCLLTSVGIITVCSKSSPLYPFNDWVDAQCFFTVGKSMMHGIVPYRDLFEQKGPFLYFVHGLASLVSKDTFLGVYLLEILAAFFFLYISYRVCCLFLPTPWTAALMPIAALLTYTNSAFCFGDSVEELCLPFFAYAILVSARSLKNGTPISAREYLLIGITSGLVFWSKFTLVGFYLGWFLVPMVRYLQARQWKALLQAVGAVAAGVVLVTIPFVIYFGIHHAIDDWLMVYIYDNLFLYTVETGLWENLRTANLKAMLFAKWMVRIGALSLPLLFCKKDKVWFYHVLSMMLLTFLFQFMGGRNYRYYLVVFSVFAPVGLLCAVYCLREVVGRLGRFRLPDFAALAMAALCILLAFLTTPNRDQIGAPKESMPQYQFREIILQKENPTLLNYGFLDGGFYTACDILPNCKAFCKLNVPLEEMWQLQEDYVDQGICDFVVTRGQMLDSPLYEYVAQGDSVLDGEVYTYYLHQRVEAAP